MLRRTDIAPSAFVTLAMIVAVVAVMVPTCVMVGCTMSGGKMFVPFGSGLSMSAACSGTYAISKAPIATVPSGADTSLLAFVALAVGAVVFAAPTPQSTPVRSVRDGPPPSPEDPGEARLQI